MIALHGHRGARGLAPENTLAGFARAIALGVDAIECDVALTADDVVVVTHDAALNPDLTRGPDGRWLAAPGPLIRSLRYEQLMGYDLGRMRPGSALSLAFPDQIPQDGARIPRLQDVLALIPPPIRLDIEMKTFPGQPEQSASAEALAEAVMCVAGADRHRVTIMSFDWRGLRWLRRHHANVQLAFLTSGETEAQSDLWWAGVSLEGHAGSVPQAVLAEGGTIWAPEYVTLTEAALDSAHRLGLSVVPWTVNQPADMARLARWGVDGVITDRPDLFHGAIVS